MNILQNEHLEILKVLNDCQVQFLLVGGAAVNYYGYSRTTGDVDVWINTENKNKEKLLLALEKLDLLVEDIDIIRNFDLSKPFVFHVGDTPPNVIDFMTVMKGLKWDEAWQERQPYQFEGIELNFIHLNHLKINKLLSGRPKDMEDLNQLAKIEERRKSRG